VKIALRIARQDGPGRPRRYELFRLELPDGSTVSTALHSLRRSPVTAEGRRVAPIAFESNCRSDCCGACTLLIDGRVGLACRTALREKYKGQPTVLEPLSKLPVVRDLIVDRSVLGEEIERRGGFVDAGGTHEPTDVSAALDACTRCGACLEACPRWGARSAFVGAAVLAEIDRVNRVDPGRAERRLRALMAPGGVADCGKARNCVEVCPESLPLFDSILALEGETTRLWLRVLLRG
jgi:succinate dehydrogenase / fumarate reductase iron-sulfur subunit